MKQQHIVLFNQLVTYRSELLSLVEDVSAEEGEVIPEGFSNNIRWNLGHLYLDQYLWIQALTKEEIGISKNFNKWFGFGTSPKDFTSETPSLEQLKILLKDQPSKIKSVYGDRLEEGFPPTEMGLYTIEQVLVRTIFHEGMHMQAIIDLKKFI